MKKILIKSFQLLILLIIRLAYAGRVRKDITGLNITKAGPIVIASNHANSLDPFIIACFMPLRTIFKIFPYRFMTANVYYHRWWKPLAWLAGCYPAKARAEGQDSKEYGVAFSTAAFKEGYTIVMFPEGKRTHAPGQAKPGISYILQDLGVRPILCRLDWKTHNRFKRISMTVRSDGSDLDLKDPNAIMKAIYALPVV
jgi:1-acyl-sn-glycerol-3-phosphate acyltransferase